MNIKKILTPLYILTILILLSLGVIALVSTKDYFMSPENKLYTALEYMKKNNVRKAEKYFVMSAESDNNVIARLSSYYLGNLYLKGEHGFKINPKKAEKYLTKSANLGSVRSAYELALLYDVGDKIPEDREKAISYMLQAANAKNPDALYAMGVWAERGYMGDVPFGKIVSVYENAAELGQKNAMKSLIAIYSTGFGKFPYNVERANYWENKLTREK